MASCCPKCTPKAPSKTKLVGCFYFPLQKPWFCCFKPPELIPALCGCLPHTTFQNVTARLHRSPRLIRRSAKALIWKRFVYLDTMLASGWVTAPSCSEICAVRGFHRGLRPVCSLIGPCSTEAGSVVRSCVLIGLRCCQSSANASVVNSLLSRQEKTKQFFEKWCLYSCGSIHEKLPLIKQKVTIVKGCFILKENQFAESLEAIQFQHQLNLCQINMIY